jgi:hypothetical protein
MMLQWNMYSSNMFRSVSLGPQQYFCRSTDEDEQAVVRSGQEAALMVIGNLGMLGSGLCFVICGSSADAILRHLHLHCSSFKLAQGARSRRAARRVSQGTTSLYSDIAGMRKKRYQSSHQISAHHILPPQVHAGFITGQCVLQKMGSLAELQLSF